MCLNHSFQLEGSINANPYSIICPILSNFRESKSQKVATAHFCQQKVLESQILSRQGRVFREKHESELVFSLTSDHGTVKTYNLGAGKLGCDNRKQCKVHFFTIFS